MIFGVEWVIYICVRSGDRDTRFFDGKYNDGTVKGRIYLAF